MNTQTALTTVLHAIRAKKPEAQVAEETGIAPSMLRKYRSGHERPHLDEWPALIRSAYEADPQGAALLAQAAIPPELFGVHATQSQAHSLTQEILEAGAAYGKVSRVFLMASADGNIDQQELDDIESAYHALMAEAEQGLAAIEKKRNIGPG